MDRGKKVPRVRVHDRRHVRAGGGGHLHEPPGELPDVQRRENCVASEVVEVVRSLNLERYPRDRFQMISTETHEFRMQNSAAEKQRCAQCMLRTL